MKINNMGKMINKNKKSQAALEFLTTYGWAIMIIILSIGALAYFGVFSPKDVVGEKCISNGDPFFCIDFTGDYQTINQIRTNKGLSPLSGPSLQIMLRNTYYDTIYINSTICEDDNGNVVNGEISGSLVNGYYEVDSNKMINITCDFGSNYSATGDLKKIKVNVFWKKSPNGFIHTTTITVFTKLRR